MLNKNFKKILKENKKNLKKIIYMHINGDIYLTQKQLNEVLKIKNKMEVK